MATIPLRKTLKTNIKIKIYHIDNVNSAQTVTKTLCVFQMLLLQKI